MPEVDDDDWWETSEVDDTLLDLVLPDLALLDFTESPRPSLGIGLNILLDLLA